MGRKNSQDEAPLARRGKAASPWPCCGERGKKEKKREKCITLWYPFGLKLRLLGKIMEYIAEDFREYRMVSPPPASAATVDGDPSRVSGVTFAYDS
jgi:hypothetical protein